MEKYVKDYPWLYYNVVDSGYKCKTCEMFPPFSTRGNAKFKFASEAVKSLTDHPRRFLQTHQDSHKHINATKQYEGILCTQSVNLNPNSSSLAK